MKRVIVTLASALPTGKAALRAAFREISVRKNGQRIGEGSSIIQSRPNGFSDTLDIPLDMDHLL